MNMLGIWWVHRTRRADRMTKEDWKEGGTLPYCSQEGREGGGGREGGVDDIK